MPTAKDWIDKILFLPRPEYPKQAEALLTDLIWRSKGSGLAGNPNYLKELSKLQRTNQKPKLPGLPRLIYRRAGGGNLVIETFPLAEATPIDNLISRPPNTPSPVRAVLEALIAPRSRGDHSLSCVPIHPSHVALQTLHGMVNKDDPPDMADIIETISFLGGAEYEGLAAINYLSLFVPSTKISDGLTGLMEALAPAIADQVWTSLPRIPSVQKDDTEQPKSLPNWPRQIAPATIASDSQINEQNNLSSLPNHRFTPFSWFWDKWFILCDPSNRWFDVLPARRFTDWALCLLRTGLAFAYIWEAEFFYKLYLCVVEKAQNVNSTATSNALKFMLDDGATLATIEAGNVTPSQKDAIKALNVLLARGHTMRDRFRSSDDEIDFTPRKGERLDDVFLRWLDGLDSNSVNKLAEPLEISEERAKNTKYFVRYLLQTRVSDDDAADQADIYYMARSNSRNFWFDPGPEWLVVVTSLLSMEPGGKCTLGMLMNDLSRLGVRVDRSVIVEMLESAGLSTDSPDADDAIVIRSSF